MDPDPSIIKQKLQGSIYWKGNKYGLMGKKYHENNAREPTKKEKKKKRTREKKT
jgi:hypothetical protein